MNPVPASPDPLAGLRGYHLPDAVGWWPPAPGWWLLAGLLLGLAVALALYVFRRRRRRAAARLALNELTGLRASLAADHDAAAFARGLSMLLRRFVLARFPREQAAGLTGERWVDFLDSHGGGGQFRNGSGRLLVDAPYRPAADLPVEELADLVERWVRHNRELRA